MEKERRTIEQSASQVCIETRADGQDYIAGRAIVFNQWSQVLGGWFKEMINPRALDGCDMTDVLNKYNHNLNYLLGRTPDTLFLEVREDGLWYFTPYDPQDPDHVMVRRKIEKKLVRGSSFEFSIAENGSKWTTEQGDGVELREVLKIAKLYDVAPVVNPAYLQTDTSIAKRDFDSAKGENPESESRDQEPVTTGETPAQPQNQLEAPVSTVAPLSVYKRKLQLLTTP